MTETTWNLLRTLDHARRGKYRAGMLTIAIAVILSPAFAAAAPGITDPQIVHGPTSLANSPLYRVRPDGVFERKSTGDAGWQSVEGLPTRVMPGHLFGTPLPVTAFAVDPADRTRLLAAVGAQLFFSASAGATWSEIDIVGTINQSTYVTSAVFDPCLPDRWMVGTSYDGLYLTEDGGSNWKDLTEEWTIDQLYLGAGFYEEIAGLDILADGTVLVTVGLGGGFVTLDLIGRSATRLRPLTDGEQAYRAPLRPSVTGIDLDAEISLPPSVEPANGFGDRTLPAAQAAAARRTLAADRTGIYVAAPNASVERLPEYFDYLDRHGFNSIVVDIKNDYGRVTYDTALDLPLRVGAADPIVDLSALILAAAQRGVYVIGRVVVFKDPMLFSFDSNRYALWDSARNRPWGVFRTVADGETDERRLVQVEHWVDPYSPEVWAYNISIAVEAESLGVDEIQFDYVRFPSDGNTESIRSRFLTEGASRVEALEGFLAAARRQLSVPIGIDVFGFNAWSRMSYLGQDIARLGRYVDVISPMFYPSHFARSFLPDLSYLERSRILYDAGTRRAREIATGPDGDPVLIRPYVQAFLIGPELDYEMPDYLRYLQLQLEGAADAAADGYTLWNASGRYYMLP